MGTSLNHTAALPPLAGSFAVMHDGSPRGVGVEEEECNGQRGSVLFDRQNTAVCLLCLIVCRYKEKERTGLYRWGYA